MTARPDLSGTYLDSRGKPFTAKLTDTGYYKITDPKSDYVFWVNPNHAAAYVQDGTWRTAKPNRRSRAAIVAVAALLTFIPLTTHAMPAYPDTLTPPPVGCVVTGWTPDDFSAMAVCAGGYLVTKEDGTRGAWDDIPYAVGTTRVGPDANGAYWDWPIWD